MDREQSINRAKEEIARLHREIQNCAHCEALRGQMVRLSYCIPPDPVQDRRDRMMQWVYTGPLADFEEVMERMGLPKELKDL